MSSGPGFAVGVTVMPVDPMPSPWELADPDPAPRLDEPLSAWLPARRSAGAAAALLQQIVFAEAQLAALRAELVLDLATGSPVPSGQPSGTVSEFAPDEVAAAQNCSRSAAVTLLDQAELLTTVLPGTFNELRLGRLDWPRARAIAAEVAATGRETDPAVIAEMETAVLPRAGELSVRGLREAVRAELLARDAAAADRRREQRARGADVTVRPVGDGMSEFRVVMPHPEARACRDVADQHARAAKDAGDIRPLGVLRTGAVADLILRPWQERPSVTAHLTVVAPLAALTPGAFLASGAPRPAAFTPPGAAAPIGAVDGEPITAAHLRELLTQFDALGLRAPAGGSVEIAITDGTGALLALTGRGELERLARRGCPEHPDGACACPVLGPPGPVDRYRPSASLYRFVKARDRACRHPGCTVRAGWADLDHVLAHADGGETSCANLCCLCRRHHRLKTFAPGWQHTMSDDGVLTVITPSGVTRISRPPGFRVLTEPPQPPPDLADDPPPF
ncbi:HNH endonuclease signature motif containing protein [Blastococcus sp. LR1]|uniref:HNH endonuclease n=1 Tax=Blastococcus sp. LR1 TaxID=2877000 RepID=UPI001CCBECED|nr:HNH endonuclease signature motif containing protein [Blastococcus sp. LR1]MCA0143428.1 HNH endonuclease [Blastococcus sp. LR1]